MFRFWMCCFLLYIDTSLKVLDQIFKKSSHTLPHEKLDFGIRSSFSDLILWWHFRSQVHFIQMSWTKMWLISTNICLPHPKLTVFYGAALYTSCSWYENQWSSAPSQLITLWFWLSVFANWLNRNLDKNMFCCCCLFVYSAILSQK